MQKRPRPLTNPYKQQKGKSDSVINHLLNASKLLTSFISNSYRKVVKVLGPKKSPKDINIDQNSPDKTSSLTQNQSILLRTNITEGTYTSEDCCQKKQNTNDNLVHSEQKRQKSILQANINNKKVSFIQNTSTRFQNQDKHIYSQVDPQNQKQMVQKLSQNDTQILGLTQDDSLVRYQKGYKKIKIQEKEEKLTRFEKTQIELILAQTPKIVKHFQQLENQIKKDLLSIETQTRKVETQSKYSPHQYKKQLEAQYDKMMNKPRKIEIARQKQDIKRLWRQVRSKEVDAEKRFQQYKKQRIRKMKEKWSIQVVKKLKSDSIVPTFEKIAAERREQKIRIQEEKRKIQEEKQKIQEQKRKIKEENRKIQQENKKKTTIEVRSLQKEENVEEFPKPAVQVNQQSSKTEKNNDIFKEAPKAVAQTIQNQAVIQKTDKKTEINMPNNSNTAQPSQSFQAKIKKLMNPVIQRSLVEVQNKLQPEQIKENNKLGQQKSNKNTVLQIPKKSNNLQSNQNEILKNQLENKSSEQKANPIIQSTVNKINPFLSSTLPSSKLSMQDLINKNPQFTILQNVEPIPQMPQTTQPSAAANLFTSGNTSYNAFKINRQPQLNPQIANIPFIQNQNKFIPPQPFQMQQSNFMNSQNRISHQNYNHFSQPVQQNYPNPSYNMSQNHNNPTNMGYQPGMFAADTNHARNLFESKQAIQPSLFAHTTPTQSTNHNRNHSRGGPSARHLKKSKEVRIA